MSNRNQYARLHAGPVQDGPRPLALEALVVPDQVAQYAFALGEKLVTNPNIGIVDAAALFDIAEAVFQEAEKRGHLLSAPEPAPLPSATQEN